MRIHGTESCDFKNMKSLVKWYIPNLIFSGHSQLELRYILPLENVNKFPDLFSDLNSFSNQGIIHYGVSMTTLEDDFLRLEEEATVDLEATLSQGEKSVIIVSNLCKEYKIKQAGSVFKKKKKIATKNVSFCVKKGEVLGLLGPNGAGRSTAIKMVTGETTLTAGKVLMKRGDGATFHLQDHTSAFLRYCPQEDSLWPDLTVHEHLQVYVTMKGVSKEDTAAAVNRKMIRAALKAKQTGAILKMHYMEEAEAVCNHVAIMVSWQIRCIGSIQYLKNMFGKGYLLEIKVKHQERADLLHAEILRIFPSAARQEW
nr:PREDICTED: ATP-binding cassette sub-family A member 8-like [Opisthocomus hoazin]